MTQQKKDKTQSNVFGFRSACLATTGYLLGCTSYTIYQSTRAGLPLEKTIVLSGLSFFLSLVVPIFSGIIGHEVGRAGGALVGEVGAVSYEMMDGKNGKSKGEKFKNTARDIGVALGIAATIGTGLWGLHEFMQDAMVGADHHSREGKKKQRRFGFNETPRYNRETTVFWPGSSPFPA